MRVSIENWHGVDMRVVVPQALKHDAAVQLSIVRTSTPTWVISAISAQHYHTFHLNMYAFLSSPKQVLFRFVCFW